MLFQPLYCVVSWESSPSSWKKIRSAHRHPTRQMVLLPIRYNKSNNKRLTQCCALAQAAGKDENINRVIVDVGSRLTEESQSQPRSSDMQSALGGKSHRCWQSLVENYARSLFLPLHHTPTTCLCTSLLRLYYLKYQIIQKLMENHTQRPYASAIQICPCTLRFKPSVCDATTKS